MNTQYQLKTILEDESIKVGVDEDRHFIYVEWLRHPDTPTFRANFLKLADIVLEKKCRLWLSDARAIHYMVYADQNWLLSEMLPVLKQSQLQKFARLVAPDSLLMLDVVRVYNVIDKLTELNVPTKLEIFTDKQLALNWLFSNN